VLGFGWHSLYYLPQVTLTDSRLYRNAQIKVWCSGTGIRIGTGVIGVSLLKYYTLAPSSPLTNVKSSIFVGRAPKDSREWQKSPVSLFAQAKIWYVVESIVAVACRRYQRYTAPFSMANTEASHWVDTHPEK
jgi:hypothetical protein